MTDDGNNNEVTHRVTHCRNSPETCGSGPEKGLRTDLTTENLRTWLLIWSHTNQSQITLIRPERGTMEKFWSEGRDGIKWWENSKPENILKVEQGGNIWIWGEYKDSDGGLVAIFRPWLGPLAKWLDFIGCGWTNTSRFKPGVSNLSAGSQPLEWSQLSGRSTLWSWRGGQFWILRLCDRT